MDDSYSDHRDEVLGVAYELGLRTVDFAETVSRHPDPKSLYPHRGLGHFDEDGYQRLTETILRCVATSSTAGVVCS